jgi:hypothetical protein
MDIFAGDVLNVCRGAIALITKWQSGARVANHIIRMSERNKTGRAMRTSCSGYSHASFKWWFHSVWEQWSVVESLQLKPFVLHVGEQEYALEKLFLLCEDMSSLPNVTGKIKG